jgi:hypothetical protein
MKILSPFVIGILTLTLSHVSSFAANKTANGCPTGHHWVNRYYRKAYIRTDGTPVSATNVNAHCQLNPTSYNQWKNRLKSILSERWKLKKEKPRKWTIEERERVLEALASLPPELLMDSVKTIFRLEKSSLYDQNPAAGEAGEIALYESAFASKQNLTRILAHEFAHEVYRQLSNANKDEYRIAADWLLVKNPRADGGYQLVPNRDNDQYVEEDGLESLSEDFSNNIEYFLFDPETLQKKTPKAYQWIKKHFNDNFKVVKGRP